MTDHPPTLVHNFMLKAAPLFQHVRPGFAAIDVKHDDWCDALHDRGFCNCDPEVSIVQRLDGQLP